MNLVGKILVLLILIMSLVFMSFAVSVYSTHKNWMDVVNNPREQASPMKPAGLKFQLEDERTRNQQLTEQLAKLQESAAAEKKALEDKIAKLETKKSLLETQDKDLVTQLGQLKDESAKQLAALTTAQTALDDKLKQIDTLRGDITSAQTQRDENFKEVVKLTEQVNARQIELENLQQIKDRLMQQLAKSKVVLERHGLSPEMPIDNVPPKVDGVVLATGKDGLVEISIGSDDGLRRGNTLEVFKADKYKGRIEVMQTAPDKAVAKIIPSYQKGRIERDDRVATRLN